MRVHTLALAAFALASTTSCSKLVSLATHSDAGGGDPGIAALPSLETFEGEIDGFMRDNKPGAQQVNLSLFLKTKRVRFQMPAELAKGGPAAGPFGEADYLIYDGDKKKIDMVSDPKKEAIEIDLNSGKPFPGFSSPSFPSGSSGGSHGPSGPPTKVTETGKFDTVAGYKCEYWDVTSDHKEATICVATQGFSLLSIPMTGIPTEHAWMLKLLDGNHFPLRFIGYEKDGTTEEKRAEITKIDKKSLPDTEFQVPAGYKIVDIEKLFSGFGFPGGQLPHPPIRPH
jgi:Domain of unknown function (DUF4412)